MPSTTSPLAGLRVVELTEALAGPYCAMMLGDLGAEVIKVERPGVGDQSRGWGPPFVAGESAYFLSTNRNKRSLELNIKAADDLALLHRLIGRADVFLTNNPRLASLERARLDPTALATLNPRLIWAGISGYGHSGPRAGQPGYDLIAQGEAGLMALTGEPEGGPARFPTPMADISAGLYTLIGILSALWARDRQGGSGRGQMVDVALLDSQVTWLANLGGSLLVAGQKPGRLGNAHPSITPYQPLRARDKLLLVAIGSERLWQATCQLLDASGALAKEPRFGDNASRNQHRQLLIAELEKLLAERDAADWLADFAAAGIPAGPIHLPEETLQDEQLLERGMVVELEHPLVGLVRSIGCPIQLSAGGPTYRRYPPRLGEHNAEIRAEFAAD